MKIKEHDVIIKVIEKQELTEEENEIYQKIINSRKHFGVAKENNSPYVFYGKKFMSCSCGDTLDKSCDDCFSYNQDTKTTTAFYYMNNQLFKQPILKQVKG